MGVIVEEQVLTCSIPAPKFFKAFFLDSNELMPKILPSVFKSIEFSEGSGGPGSIKLITFQEGNEVKTMKHIVDEVDETNHVYKFNIIEGGNMGVHFESVSSVNKVEPGPDGGCVLKSTTTYTTKGDNHSVIEEDIKKAKEGLVGFFQATVAHLLSN